MKPKPADSENAETSALAAELHIVLGALKRRLREHGDVADLTSAQKSVLLRLERDGPATGSALARAEAMRPQSMGAIIAVLEAAGYVAGEPGPWRRRVLSGASRPHRTAARPSCRSPSISANG